MRMISALRCPAIALLWLGQAFSAVGDEIYRVGLTWLAVGIVGANAGYLAAGQSAALMFLSLFAGHWADHWAPLKTMIRTDLLRGVIVLVPVFISYFSPPSMLVIWSVAIPLAALGAFFDPALQSVLPRYAPSVDVLRATNGLMGTTFRIARLIGPLLVGLLAGIIPMIHFFSLDAFSFLISAICIFSVRNFPQAKKTSDHSPPPSTGNFLQSMQQNYNLVCREKGLDFVFLSKALTGCTWSLLFLSLTLLIRDIVAASPELHAAATATKIFGLVIAAYGFGNLLGVLFFGNIPRRRAYLTMYCGYAFFSFGFFAIAMAPTIKLIMVACAFAGFFGPMNDLGFIDLMQKIFPFSQMARVFRFRIAVETAATLALMLCAPEILRHFSPRPVMFAGGIVWLLMAILGFSHRGAKLFEVES